MNHLVFRCKKYDEEREFMFRKMEKEKIKLWLNVDEFIKNKQWKAMEIIYQFIKKKKGTAVKIKKKLDLFAG